MISEMSIDDKHIMINKNSSLFAKAFLFDKEADAIINCQDFINLKHKKNNKESFCSAFIDNDKVYIDYYNFSNEEAFCELISFLESKLKDSIKSLNINISSSNSNKQILLNNGFKQDKNFLELYLPLTFEKEEYFPKEKIQQIIAENNLVISNAKPEDAKEIFEILTSTPELKTNSMSYSLEELKNANIIIAKKNGKIIGFNKYDVYFLKAESDIIVIIPSERGKKISLAISDRFVDIIKEKNAKYISIIADTANKRAIDIWKKKYNFQLRDEFTLFTKYISHH